MTPLLLALGAAAAPQAWVEPGQPHSVWLSDLEGDPGALTIESDEGEARIDRVERVDQDDGEVHTVLLVDVSGPRAVDAASLASAWIEARPIAEKLDIALVGEEVSWVSPDEVRADVVRPAPVSTIDEALLDEAVRRLREEGRSVGRIGWVAPSPTELDRMRGPVLRERIPRDIRLDLVVVQPRGADGEPVPIPYLSGLAASSGGVVAMSSELQIARDQARGLARGGATRHRADLSFCGVQDGMATVKLHDGPHVLPLRIREIPAATCAAPVPDEPGSDLPWTWILVGLGAATAGLAATVLLLRRRPAPVEAPTVPAPQSPPPPPDEPEVPAARPTGLHLRVVGGPLDGQTWAFEGAVVRIGAGPDNDVILDLPRVSRSHLRLERFGSGAIFVVDERTVGGTWVDGTRLEGGERRLLRKGERVDLGHDIILELVDGEQA